MTAARPCSRGPRYEIVDSSICALQPGSRKNACYGDSGGPLMASPKPRTFVQVGIVSRGCGNMDLPNIYTRVVVLFGLDRLDHGRRLTRNSQRSVGMTRVPMVFAGVLALLGPFASALPTFGCRRR